MYDLRHTGEVPRRLAAGVNGAHMPRHGLRCWHPAASASRH